LVNFPFTGSTFFEEGILLLSLFSTIAQAGRFAGGFTHDGLRKTAGEDVEAAGLFKVAVLPLLVFCACLVSKASLNLAMDSFTVIGFGQVFCGAALEDPFCS